MDGVLVIDKPAGPTSHDVVAVARRSLRERRIGHTGTLDPMATGVLPLVIGRATRLATLLSSGEKEYEAAVRLGAATPTYDAADRLMRGEGPPPPPAVPRDAIAEVLARFRGSFDQTPPPFSAKKVAGVPAYELARRERAPELKAVPVTVFSLELIAYDAGLLRLRMRTSAGFYVRSLAHEIGLHLGCGAHLESLRRTRAGAFGLQGSVTVEALATDPSAAHERLLPLGVLAPELPAVVVTERGARKAAHGNSLIPQDFAESGTATTQWGMATDSPSAWEAVPNSRGQLDWSTAPFTVRLFDQAGRLLAIADAGRDRVLRPSIVLV